jgi:hypothetical protein
VAHFKDRLFAVVFQQDSATLAVADRALAVVSTRMAA